MSHFKVGADNLFIGDKYAKMEQVALRMTEGFAKSTFVISPQYQYQLKDTALPIGTETTVVPFCMERDKLRYEQDYKNRLSEIVRLDMIPKFLVLENCPFDVRLEFEGHFDACTVLYIFHSGCELQYLRYHNVLGAFVFKHEDIQEAFAQLFNRELSLSTRRDILKLKQAESAFLSATFGIPLALR
ncbi:hypothetical protein LMH73_004745 [Vibrio splendidus]|nr:hypothetical protein [Vibrio splendidus]MCC4882537.1 hypothetical protein [Vibrio splendidus]